MSLLEVSHIRRVFDRPLGQGKYEVLRDISLRADPGDSISLTGPSGSGKSTLLNLIGALDRPSSGRIRLNDRDLDTMTEKELAALRNLDLGFIFQLHHLLPQCTVLENVLVPTLPSTAGKGDKSSARKRAERLLRRVGLESHLDYFPAQLSGGELQRTAVARALINQPKLILADEPTGSLDRESAERLAQLLMELNQEEGTALIIATHSSLLAARMKVHYHLRDGLLEEVSSAEP